MRKKIIDRHVKGKEFRNISEWFDVFVTTVASIIKKFKFMVHGALANLPRCGYGRNQPQIKQDSVIGRKRDKDLKKLPKR